MKDWVQFNLYGWRWAVNRMITIMSPNHGDAKTTSEKGCAFINGEINPEQILAGY